MSECSGENDKLALFSSETKMMNMIIQGNRRWVTAKKCARHFCMFEIGLS